MDALAREFIDEQITIPYQDMLPGAIRGAYKRVKELSSKTDFLMTPTATYTRGHLIAWAAEFQISDLLPHSRWYLAL